MKEKDLLIKKEVIKNIINDLLNQNKQTQTFKYMKRKMNKTQKKKKITKINKKVV